MTLFSKWAESCPMSQTELCARTGINKTTMSYAFAGREDPLLDTLYLISKALGIRLSELLRQMDD